MHVDLLRFDDDFVINSLPSGRGVSPFHKLRRLVVIPAKSISGPYSRRKVQLFAQVDCMESLQ